MVRRPRLTVELPPLKNDGKTSVFLHPSHDRGTPPTACWSPASADLQGLHTSPPSSLGTSAAPARRWLPRRFVSHGRQSGGAVAPAQTPASPCADAPGTRGCGTGSVRPYAVLSQSSIFGQNPKIGCQEFN